MATRLPVGTIFANEWFVSVAGGLCTTVSTAGITTAGVPFNDCATWVVVAERNLEKPGDKHLVENILDERFQAENSRRFDQSWSFSIWPTIFASRLPTMQFKAIGKPLTGAANQAPFSKFWLRFGSKLGTQMSWKLSLFCTRAQQNDTYGHLHVSACISWESWTMGLSCTREKTKSYYLLTVLLCSRLSQNLVRNGA